MDGGIDRKMTHVGVVALAVLTGFAAFVLNVLPTGCPLVTCAALVAALVLIHRLQHKVLSGVAVVVAIACVVAIGTPLPGVLANRLAERCTAGPSDAIIVLEGDAGQDRIIHALRVFRQNWAPLLIVTGTSSLPDGWRYFETATLFGLRAGQLRRLEVRRGGTYGEALALHEDPLGQRLRRVILVTSPAHSARAANVFRKFGYEVCSVPSPAHNGDPDAWGRINLARQLIRETAAWAYYRLRAWV